MAQSPEQNASTSEIIRYDLGWNAINALLRSGRSLSGHERNCCFLNTRGSRFANVSAATGLDFVDDGRVLSLADWDYDGDVDLWIANRSGPQVRFVRNELKGEQHYVAVKLQGVSCNRDAIGARVVVVDELGNKQLQTLRAGEGYLSQSSKWLHFGLGSALQIKKLVVFWPNGKRQVFRDLEADRFYRFVEGDETAEVWQVPQSLRELEPSEFSAPPISDKARIVLLNPIPLPSWRAESFQGEPIRLTATSDRPRLVNLWASWCQPCLVELAEWKQQAALLKNAGLDVITVNVDEENVAKAGPHADVVSLVTELDLPFRNGWDTARLATQFDVVQRSLLSRQRPLPMPSSFLIDQQGRLRVVYKGPVSVETILADTKLLDSSTQEILAAAIPFPGRWLRTPPGSTPLLIALKLVDGDRSDEAQEYIQELVRHRGEHPEYVSAGLLNLLGAISLDKREFRQAAEAFTLALELEPGNRQAHIELGGVLLGFNKGRAALPHFEAALATNANDPELRYKLGIARLQMGDFASAEQEMRRVLELREDALAHWQLGAIHLALGHFENAIDAYEEAIVIRPELMRSANDLAWLLATLDDDELRNGERAVEIAEYVYQQSETPTANEMDTLSAGYAENGQFDKAVDVGTRAAQLARESGDRSLVKQIEERLRLYRQKKPYRNSLN
ncbi:MAG: tetratricopeptide repeat protein [Planctomycetaceae bacterium]|nr:tetratricopeptide repeat protein [Planctomycetaceae bacterium]